MSSAMREAVEAIAAQLGRTEYVKGLRLLLKGFPKEQIREKQLHIPLRQRLFNTYRMN